MEKQNETERKFNKLPICVAEFIKLVIKKMRYRKKVRQDVRAELSAHFEDELKDCTTDEEKEQKAQQLIEQFGDVKLLGVLLRRAKKRCRPLWRKALVRSFQILGIIVVYFLICFSRLGIGRPTISVNYIDWLNDKVRAGRDESNNALPHYEKAAQVSVKMPTQITNVHRRWPSDLNDVEMQARLKWISDNKQAIELLRQGTEKPYYWSLYEATEPDLMKGDFMTNVMQSSPGYRQVAFAMESQILHKAFGGDIGSALSDCVVLQEFGSHMQGKGFLIEQLVGIAIEALGHKTIYRIIDGTDVSADVLKNTQEELKNVYRNRAKPINLEAEKVFWYDLVQRGFTDDGEGSGRVLKEGLPLVAGNWKSGLWEFVSWSYPDRREVTAGIDKYFEEVEKLLQKTPLQLRNETPEADGWYEIAKDCFMLQIQGPAHSRMVQISWRVETSRAAIIAVLAVLRYEKEKGEYPADLNELVEAGYLKELSIDPYSDKPLVYKKTDGNFTLYSLGQNFKDDGGQVYRDDKGRVRKYADEGDWVFWPVQK